jgi:proline utilization trans-activator
VNTTPQSIESIRNPLFEERPWFHNLNSSDLPVLIGEAADAAFATRCRQVISIRPISHIPRTNYVGDDVLVHSDVPWPSMARARFLVEVSMKTLCQSYHIVRRSAVIASLDSWALSTQPKSRDANAACKLWALFAIGELYSTKSSPSEVAFPGLGYFIRASEILRVVQERPNMDVIETSLLLVSPGGCLGISRDQLPNTI